MTERAAEQINDMVKNAPAAPPVGDPPKAKSRRRSSRSGGTGKGCDDTPAGGTDRRLAHFPLTDLGNAERFCERYKDLLRHSRAVGWLAWDGRRWAQEGAEEKVKIAEHDTVRAIQDEAAAVRGTDADYVYKVTGKGDEVMLSDALAAWGRASESANRLGVIAKRAQAYLSVAPSELDSDPSCINVENGTLVVGKPDVEGAPYVEFRAHDPSDLITKISPVTYDRDATCPQWDAFLARVQPSPETRRFLDQWHGLSLTGDVREQKLAVFWGKGKNGKSTLEDAVAYVAGDYSETVPIETFLIQGRGRNAGQATPDLAILPGVRHLRTSEPDKGAKLSEALIKLATGGEPMQVRHLNRDYFKFCPEFKLTISGNYRPTIQGADDGIWRRVILVPWQVQIPEAEQDKQLGEKLRAEASGILNRLLDGLCDWLDNGLVEPAEVVAATADYRTDSDPLGRFLAACVETSQGDRVQSSVMHELFCVWARANGEREWSNKGMSNALRERGFKSKHSNVVWWLDVKLTRDVHDFVDADGKPRRQQVGDDPS